MPIPFSGLIRQWIPFWDTPLENNAADAEGGGGIGLLYQENPWDTLFLKGVQIPGKCTVKALPTIKFDEKKPPGHDGLTITAQGYIPGPVDIEILLWTAKQWTTYQEVRGQLWTTPRRGGQIKAMDIRSPATDDAQIKSIVIKGWSLPEAGSVFGTMVVKIKAVEFLPSDKKTKTHTVAKSDVEMDERLSSKEAKNAGGESPGKTDTSPRGAKKDKKPGSA